MSCVPTPTETQYAGVITTTVLQTVVESVTTFPPSVTTRTLVSQSCSPLAGHDDRVGGCVLVPVTTTSTGTIDDAKSTIPVSVDIIVEVIPPRPTTTLFAPCDGDNPANPNSSDVPGPSTAVSLTSSESSSIGYPPSEILITTVVTPIPSEYISTGIITMSDGKSYLTAQTITSTVAPTALVVPSPAPPATTHYNVTSSDDHDSTRSVTAPVVGGVLGGFFGFIGLVVLGWIIWLKRYSIFSCLNRNRVQDSPSSSPIFSPKLKIYDYGLVGRASSHPPGGTSPPPQRQAQHRLTSLPGLPVRHPYHSLPDQIDVPRESTSFTGIRGHANTSDGEKRNSFPSESQMEIPRQGHSLLPHIAREPGYSRSTTGNATASLLPPPPGLIPPPGLSVPITSTPGIPASRSSIAAPGSYSPAQQYAFQRPMLVPYMQQSPAHAGALPPGAAPPVFWHDQGAFGQFGEYNVPYDDAVVGTSRDAVDSRYSGGISHSRNTSESAANRSR